ncbi:rhomboid family intramembrane serine protease [Leifsonia kafniensis]|uniref:Rhomboid family intramembrane serine protease n=2 Tax=Leifsonia kafniensis TaxID=475957 RepID=A0ABP7KLE8_9MICO
MSGMPQAAANYCYRHPDRQSFVLCQRCGRTICGECQTQAAVGVICPECMREQRATAPRTKPALLTRLNRMTGDGTPVVTYSIIAVSVFVYLLQLIPALGVTEALLYAGAYSYPQFFEPWRMLTSVFVHSTGGFPFHILLNMYTLWIFGSLLERMLGRWRFLVVYLLSGLAGSLGVLFLAAPNVAVVGASGAIFGVISAFLVIHQRLGANMTQLVVLVAINLVIGFIPGFGISWQAHLGGLIGGALLGLIFVQTRKRSQQTLQIALLIALAAVMILLSFSKFLV